jgi:26S proteasome regulatory subunit N1
VLSIADLSCDVDKLIFSAAIFACLINEISFLLKGLSMEIDDEIAADENDKEVLQEIVYNTKLSEGYLTLARDIEVMEPKSPEDIYKVTFVFIIASHVYVVLLHAPIFLTSW